MSVESGMHDRLSEGRLSLISGLWLKRHGDDPRQVRWMIRALVRRERLGRVARKALDGRN